MNRINEIGDTVRGQEMLGRTAERAHQRASRTSGADKQRHEKTEWDAYQTAAGNSRKHLDGSGAHFARGRDAEYDEHWDDGRYPWSKKSKTNNESKNINKKLIRLTESDLHKIVKESVNRILNEINLTNKQIRNITGISDDDELNAACMAEDEDDLASNIVKDLKDEYGFYNVYDKGVVLDFNFIKELLKQKYGMNYLGFDEKDDSHLFKNNDFVVKIWSKENYPRLSKFHLQNIHVYHA
jgi:hypothetical protein